MWSACVCVSVSVLNVWNMLSSACEGENGGRERKGKERKRREREREGGERLTVAC